MAQPSVVPPEGPRSGALPSSFDSTPEFFEEKRFAKLVRRLREEPLIPLGCAATFYAFYQATKSVRAGDHHRTNRMFRARIYAQGFTLVAMVAGSMYWKDDRLKKKELEKAMEDMKKMEKRDKWLKELEERDREDREWRSKFEDVAMRAKEAVDGAKVKAEQAAQKVELVAKAAGAVRHGAFGEGGDEAARQSSGSTDKSTAKAEQASKGAGDNLEAIAQERTEAAEQGAVEKAFRNKSVLEQVQDSGWGKGWWLVREAWRRR